MIPMPFNNARELLKKLSIGDEYFSGGNGRREWIFRGQNNSTWPLLLTAFRIDEGRHIKYGIYPAITTRYHQLIYEATILRDFFKFCDTSGQSVPEDSQLLRNMLSHLNNVRNPWSSHTLWLQDGLEWIPYELLSLAALAQHYGLPTRLLDWTYSPYVAAYFAAIGNDYAPYRGTNETIGIFAIRKSAWDNLQDIRLHTAPYAMIPNLRAQQGVFTTVGRDQIKNEQDLEKPASCTTLESVHRDIHCLTLPVSESHNLLELLSRDGIVDFCHKLVVG